MVMIKLGPPLIDINGKYNGEIYRRDQCGIHWQRPPRREDREPSEKQKLRRKAFRRLIIIWFNELTLEMILDWTRWSETHPKKNKKGETIFWTGFNWFVHFNINRILEDFPPILWPPWEWG